MKPAFRTVCVLLLALLPPTVQAARWNQSPAERFPGGEEPAPETVTALYQDRAGFMWVGSREGLTLYDGYSFVKFDHDVSDPASISANLIRAVFEDSRGNLWIGTNTGGLNRLDRTTWEFRHYRHDSTDPRTLSHDSVYTIQEDNQGYLWVGTQIGLNRLDPETGIFKHYPARPSDPQAPSHDYINTIYRDSDGMLWLGTVGGGLNRLDPELENFRSYRHDPGNENSLSSDHVFAIVEAEDGMLWLGTGEGVDRVDPNSGRVERHRFMPGEAESHGPLLVTSLALHPDGEIYLGTWSDGIKRLAPATSTGGASVFHDVDLGSQARRIVCLTTDKTGSIWVGTWGAGLDRIRPGSSLFQRLGTASDGRGMEEQEITALLVDSRNRLWIGGTVGIPSRLDPATGQVERFAQIENSALDFHEDGDGAIWAGTPAGLDRLMPDQGRLTEYRHDPEDPDSLGRGWVWTVLRDHEGRLWVGTGEGGLNLLLPDGSFRRYANNPADPFSLSENYVTVLYQDTAGQLWVGTRSGGLNRFDAATGRFHRFQPDPEDELSISHHYVSSILEDSRGRLWIGTGGGGINLLHYENGSRNPAGFTRFTEREGLVDDNVMSMQEDDDGSLWVATRQGLSRFDTERLAFVNYDTGDGLPGREFSQGTAASGPGTLYFGTNRGAVAIPRGTPFPAPAASPVVLTSIQSPEGAIRGDRPSWDLTELRIPWGEIVSFQFAVLDYGRRYRHRYAYRLAGLQDDWIELGTRRDITFTDLDPGTYTLEVRGRNDQGVVSSTATALKLEVVPPFWMTPWFRFLMMLTAAGVALGIHRWRTAALEEQNRTLQTLKDQREQALKEVQANQEALHLTYEKLRRLTSRLEAAKEDERKRIARELHDEMGQALTTAKINLELMTGIRSGEELDQRITDTISLMDLMIGQVRALSLDLRPPLLDELGLIPALKGYLEVQSLRSELPIDVQTDQVPPGLPPEIEILAFRVVQEAVTNILRHADATQVHVKVGYEPGWLEISVRDDGCGFDVDATLEKAAAGHHLGLLGIRERVDSNGGVVRLQSSPGNGTLIHIDVPLETVGEPHASHPG